MAFASRGLHDEVHSGEIDPGVMRVYDDTGAHRGYVWVNRHPDDPNKQESFVKYVLLFEGYVIPGFPNLGRNPSANVKFVWDSKSLKLQEAIDEYRLQIGDPNAHYTLVKQMGTVVVKSW